MADSPNTSPAFIQTVGVLGLPIELTNQVCTRNNPGSTPVVIYDSSEEYAQGNGALVEALDIQVTGITPDTVVMLFDKFLSETIPKWRKVAEVFIPSTSATSTAVLTEYEFPLKKILSPTKGNDNNQGLRLNSSNIQYGVALTVATTDPVIIRMYGGEY